MGKLDKDVARLHEEKGQDDLARIRRLTKGQKTDALMFLAGYDPEMLERLLELVQRQKKET